MNGGARVAEVLTAHGVGHLFTLCGGHIAPILVESKRRGVRVVDVRHEANALRLTLPELGKQPTRAPRARSGR